ncbi:unnamed protein product [Schistosoma curassoni]|uniref:Ovule protein n=1 Tax=Schistosoma curassoni TaxID=6186 RepID=A0A183JHB1_9TREM|nr:unnamed protein product [Schistosoma curassoni]
MPTQSHSIDKLWNTWQLPHVWTASSMNKKDRQIKGDIPATDEYMELQTTVCMPTQNSESSIRTSRQSRCTEMRLRELPQPTSK